MNYSLKSSFFVLLFLFITNSFFAQLRADKLPGGLQVSSFSQNNSRLINIASQNGLVLKDIYLFPSHYNTAIFTNSKDEKFTISSINFNIYSNNFDSRLSNDSIYVFDNSNIKSVEIGDKLFKKYFDDNTEENKIYQVIYEGDSFSLLRMDKFVKSEIKNALNPTEVKVHFSKISNYYSVNGEKQKMVKIKLNKKSILSLFDDKSKVIKDFVKKNKLSFSKEKDLSRILNYYESL
ncbi:hypothetical protein [Urechidicola croceus]|uniref:Uncharacterized protein n=1 Tax=Urechidicola croceus TaxID=1850246 RepID=A0A1D8PB86_9FLAO|nr:hypothetical protein [Urechidicola croceus]AOW21824.1 hypothetical protein LPB138_14535 [Urechidicola croceus]